jgi:hypothetical protein
MSADIGKYNRDRSRDHIKPKGLDGIDGSKKRLRCVLQRILIKVTTLESALNEEDAISMHQLAKSIIEDSSYVVGETSAWKALLFVQDGTYKSPKDR